MYRLKVVIYFRDKELEMTSQWTEDKDLLVEIGSVISDINILGIFGIQDDFEISEIAVEHQ